MAIFNSYVSLPEGRLPLFLYSSKNETSYFQWNSWRIAFYLFRLKNLGLYKYNEWMFQLLVVSNMKGAKGGRTFDGWSLVNICHLCRWSMCWLVIHFYLTIFTKSLLDKCTFCLVISMLFQYWKHQFFPVGFFGWAKFAWRVKPSPWLNINCGWLRNPALVDGKHPIFKSHFYKTSY